MMRSNLTGYIFEILYEAQEVKAAVQLILEMVGKHYRVGRAYVFENSWDNRYCCNTFEWCDEGIEPQKEQLSHIPYTQLGIMPVTLTKTVCFIVRMWGTFRRT